MSRRPSARCFSSGLAVAACITAASAAAAWNGLAPPTVKVFGGTNPRSVAVGDVNGDGRLDLVSANYNSDNVTVFLASGSGSYLEAVTSPIGVGGLQPYSVALGDVNGDGKLDIVTANYGSSNVSVLLGNGAGGFTPVSGSPLAINAASPTSIALVDVNGDGKLDILTANYTSHNVTVLLGNGFGGFSLVSGAPFFTGGGNPISLAVGDMNGDGKPDVVVANYGSSNVSVLLGNGAGSFSGASGSPFAAGGSNPYSVALGDVNGDGKRDAVTANFANSTLSVLLGNGSGGLAPAGGSPFAIGGTSPQGVALGDVNGDGKLDVATANVGSSNVSILLGNGSGGFTPASGSPVDTGGKDPVYVLLRDVSGDGKLDLLSANFTSNDVGVLLGNGAAAFTPSTGSPFAVGGTHPGALAIADVNGDGKLDVVTANFDSDNVSVLLGNGLGGYTKPSGSPYRVGGKSPRSVAVGDVDGDGKLDLVTANFASQDVSVLLGNGAGGFSPGPGSPFAIGGSGPRSIALGDLNNDGKLDIVVANFTSNDVSVLLGNGRGNFVPSLGSPFPTQGRAPISLVLAEMTGDANLDAIVANIGTNDVSVLAGNGSGGLSMTSGAPFGVFGSAPYSVAVGDVNGDGRRDIVTANFFSSDVSVLLNNGFGASFTPASGSPYFVNGQPVSVVLADIDEDGKRDIVTAQLYGDTVSVLLGNGSGGFTPGTGSPYASGGVDTFAVAVGDVDQDGHPDVLALNMGNNSLSTYRTGTSYGPPGCGNGDALTLCLTAQRFEVKAHFINYNDGSQGEGRAVSFQPTPNDSGYFWFFDAANMELIIKVLDGRTVNGKFWVLYGALSDVEYTITITDTSNGNVKTYHNPPHVLASVADVSALPGTSPTGRQEFTAVEFQRLYENGTIRSVSGFYGARTRREAPARSAEPVPELAATCTPNAQTLCLDGARFTARVAWINYNDGSTGSGQAIPITDQSGVFWFFQSTNIELALKVLDGRAVNGKFWVLYGALSDVEYTITITDNVTGAVKAYHNLAHNLASVADVFAF